LTRVFDPARNPTRRIFLPAQNAATAARKEKSRVRHYTSTIDLCPFPAVNFDRHSGLSPRPGFPKQQYRPNRSAPDGRTPKLPTSANLARKLLNLQAAPRTRSRLKIANFVNDFRTKK